MTRDLSEMADLPQGAESYIEASESDLLSWVAEALGAKVTTWSQISGGNRCRSWLIDLRNAQGRPDKVYLRYQPPREPSAEPYTVWREALIYGALGLTTVRAPRLLAVHRTHQAIITTAAEGRADFRRLSDDRQKSLIIEDFVRALAELHVHPLSDLPTGGLEGADTVAGCVREEIRIWTAMYEETGRTDPLIELALNWLTNHVPDADEPPVLVHGDAGPGNFLFDGNRMTGLVDWELAHPGDPMEDLAWFCMRSVMEPVPDFVAAMTQYEAASGRSIDPQRFLYHRVFVSLRVVVIRHRNVTGQPGNSIVSRALNRRLLVDALASAEGILLPAPHFIDAPATDRTAYYDGVIDDLLELSDGAPADVSGFAKNTAKVIKYLQQFDRIGRDAEIRETSHIAQLLGRACPDLVTARHDLAQSIARGQIGFETCLKAFALIVGYEAQLAAPSSGRVAERGFPMTFKKEQQA